MKQAPCVINERIEIRQYACPAIEVVLNLNLLRFRFDRLDQGIERSMSRDCRKSKVDIGLSKCVDKTSGEGKNTGHE